MDLYGCHFEYAGTPSRMYGLIIATVDTAKYVSLSGQTESHSFFNKKEKKKYHLGDSFDNSAMTFDAEVVSGKNIDRTEQRIIEKWLFHQADFCKLYVDMKDDIYAETYEFVDGKQKRLYLNCRFVNPQKIENSGGLVGYRFTVECDSCMAWQDAVTFEYELDNTSEFSNSIITVNVDSDLNDYVYPKVTIQIGDVGGDIIISNNTDDASRLTSFVSLTPNVTVVMRGDGINYISGDNYMKFKDKNFIRLLDGENQIAIVGDVVGLSFEFQNRRFL